MTTTTTIAVPTSCAALCSKLAVSSTLVKNDPGLLARSDPPTFGCAAMRGTASSMLVVTPVMAPILLFRVAIGGRWRAPTSNEQRTRPA
jgi:hypothetical protein